MERSDNQRLGDVSYQLSLIVSELRALREVIAVNGEFYVSEGEFNDNIADKLTKS